MTLPRITAICCTFGRVKQLEVALACFNTQQYPAAHELIVYNTFPGQILQGEFQNVRIINCKTRPASLGEARNYAITQALPDSVIVTWDDDDVYLPHHLENIGNVFKDNEWIWIDKQFSARGTDIVEISPGSCPLFSFKKSAWVKVGGYPHMGCGEDRAFIAKVTEQCKGERINIPRDRISFVYRWANGVYHMSGEGDDKPGRETSHERIAKDLQRRINARLVKTGVNVLKPHFDVNWANKSKQFTSTLPDAPLKTSVCIVELGRYGDIVNILPICRHVCERYAKPYLVVSKQFADILDGVSYVEPYPVDLTHDQINDALAIGRQNFGFVLQGQVWGTRFEMPRQCDAFNRESWRLLGFLHKFDDPTWAPIFDQRNTEREQTAAAKLRVGPNTLLVNVMTSHSSPWPHGAKVLQWIRQEVSGRLGVLDISALKLHRIYDLLGLMDRAAGVVSIDTAPIHFATACGVPTIVIRNSKPWLGTAPRPCAPYAAITDYDSVGKDIARELRPGLKLLMDRAVARRQIPHPPLASPPTRRIFHAVERHEAGNDAERKRKAAAQQTWKVLYDKAVVPCHFSQYPRDARRIGDRRRLPYLKDVLWAAMLKAEPSDIIMWTNDDNHLHALLPELLRFYVSIYDAVSSHRCEFQNCPVPSQASDPHVIAAASSLKHIGRDLFAFTKAWLLHHWGDIPDFILGASEFDLCLAAMIRVEKGIQSDRLNLGEVLWPCELPKGFVSHQFHMPFWNRPENTDSAPSQKHNRKLFYEWAQKHLPSLKFTPILTI